MEVKIKDSQKEKIQSAQDAYDIIQRIFYKRHKKVDLLKEHFWTIALNRGEKILCIELVSIGSNHTTIVAPQEVFRLPLYKSASQVILIHNHPSGTLTPSDSDLDVTNKLIQAGLLFDIEVIDHVITTQHTYYSFFDNGLIEKLRWDTKYALTFTRDKQIEQEISKIKKEAEKFRQIFGREKKLQGIKEGQKQGAKMQKRKIASQMLAEGMDTNLIRELTGLSAQSIGRLKTEVEENH